MFGAMPHSKASRLLEKAPPVIEHHFHLAVRELSAAVQEAIAQRPVGGFDGCLPGLVVDAIDVGEA